MPNTIALIPARSGSERIPKKNIKKLGDHPLIGWTISTALKFGRFNTVIVSSDSSDILRIGELYGAENLGLRPQELSTAESPDINWIKYSVQQLQDVGNQPEAIFILRPTSPFRTIQTLERAWSKFFGRGKSISSMRAVRPVRQHPGKMWVREDGLIHPLLNGHINSVPFHSNQSKVLPEVFIQDSSLEVLWLETLTTHNEIAGPCVAPFFTSYLEGFSIDYPEDWEAARHIVMNRYDEIELPSTKEH